MSERSRRQLEQGAEPPITFSGRHHEAADLIPPSHFEARRPGSPAVDTDPWAALSKATKDILELRQENERLRELQRASNRVMFRGHAGVESEEVCGRARSLDQERTCKWPREAGEQAEIISDQIREIHRLTGEARLLRNTLEQQATVIREKEGLVAQLTEQVGELRAELREQRREAGQFQLQCQAEADRVRSQHQLEIQRLETQLALGQAASSEEAEQLRSELKELRERYRHEVSALQEELAKQAAAKSEDNQLQMARLQDAQYQRVAEILQSAESRDKNYTALKDKVSDLEEKLRQNREKGQSEAVHFRQRLEAVTQERDTLQDDLRKTKHELESQNSVISQLRTYIGQLVPDEKQLEESRQEKEQLNNRVQHLEKERETLKATAELLNIRLRSLNDILTIHESERSRKPKQDVPERESVKRSPLVTRWREKVFALMVQLKSQEISHANDINQLHVKIANLEEELGVKEQEQALLLHSFEDRTAEMNMQRVQNQALREELASAQSDAVRFQGNAEQAENTLCHLKEVVSSFYQRFLEQETEQRKALCRLVSLGQRVTFANKRIDTIHGLLARKDALFRLQLQEKSGDGGSDTGRCSHGDLEKELELLNRERDQLAAELKKNSQLIEKKVTEARLKFDTDLKDRLVVMGQLEESLTEKTQCQQRLTETLSESQKQLADSQEAAESLRIELGRQQQKYEQALAEKVAEAEQRLAEQLSEMEKRLNEARREHTKAVVALRQTDRQAARDKERMQACEKLHEGQHQREIQQLNTKLRELERDRNLLVATLRQEGLLSQLRKSRTVALQSIAALSDEEERVRPLPDSQTSQTSSQAQKKASLAEVLNELEVLSAAVIGDQEDGDTNEEEEIE
ncbi:coiled-coil alpha-helical rod protein 1 isoform X2 [Stegostoma tigrinum]|uniref:coiled-coil alpha-helical rod protein 1 isoform X2 n=1 Tax=Stegostoma tigrinum TaxID=3053191 RepID=UPI0028709BFD|nr:coiled-coil alpha-helical rod protein 1 isoform X2 [Stegostoma tigrinum]